MVWKPYSRRSEFIRHLLPNLEFSYDIGSGVTIRASLKKHLYMFRASRRNWDIEIARKLSALITSDGVIYDIGANMGLYSLVFGANRLRQVHSFEPGREALASLRRNIEINKLTNVSVHPVVLSDHRGTCRFTLDVMSTTTSHISENGESGEELPCCDLDSYIQEHNLPIPDLIKMDIEGSDKLVFRGMRDLLASQKTLIFFEGGIREDGNVWVIDQLKEFGYSVCDLDQTTELDSSTQEYMYLGVPPGGRRRELIH